MDNMKKLKEEIHKVLWEIGGDTGWLDVRLEDVEKPIMNIFDKAEDENELYECPWCGIVGARKVYRGDKR